MTISKKKIAGSYTGAYLSGKGRTASSKAARLNVTIAAFVLKFVNNHVRRAHYSHVLVTEKNKVRQTVRVLCSFKNRICTDAMLSVPIGVRDAMKCYPNKIEIKNVLHKARTNPQVA